MGLKPVICLFHFPQWTAISPPSATASSFSIDTANTESCLWELTTSCPQNLKLTCNMIILISLPCISFNPALIHFFFHLFIYQTFIGYSVSQAQCEVLWMGQWIRHIPCWQGKEGCPFPSKADSSVYMLYGILSCILRNCSINAQSRLCIYK